MEAETVKKIRFSKFSKNSAEIKVLTNANTQHRKLTRFIQQTHNHKNGTQIPVSVDISLAEQEFEDEFHAAPVNFKQHKTC